jgi:hypothetical protein
LRIPTLTNVIASVTQNATTLSMTGMLIMIVIYIYTIIGFFNFREMFKDYNIGIDGEETCTNMVHCLITVTNYGLRNGGGIGDVAAPQSYDNFGSYIAKLIYSFSYHLVVIIILLNILFGIIIDTFACK